MGNKNSGKQIIRIEELKKSFDDKPVLKGINLDVYEGESFVILGGSGMGKTVLMKIVIGLMKPDSGRVLIEDQDITKISELHLNKIRRDIGMLFQEGALFDSMSVGENVAFGLVQHSNMKKDEIKSRVAECLKMVGLPGTEEIRPSALSGGMRKRVGLARAIAYNPKIVIYDEPTGALDPIMSAVITSLIQRLNTQLKVTSITITHDLKSAWQIADRIALLINGDIMEIGSPEEIFNSTNPYVQQFVTGSANGPIEVVK